MKLARFTINDNHNSISGLEKCQILLKSNCAAIIGKNGSGKTRFLNLIYKRITEDAQTNNDEFLLSEVPNSVQNQITNKGTYLKYIRNLIVFITPDAVKSLQSKKNQGKQFDQILNLQGEDFVTNEYQVLNDSALSYFLELSTQIVIEQINYFEKPESSFKKTKLYQNYKSLAEKFEALIEKKLEFKIDRSNMKLQEDGSASGLKGNWLLNGRIFDYTELSDGEKTLFSYILLLFLQENYHYSKTKDSIVIIDEPEAHLHPEAQIKLIIGLKELIGSTGQLIVATHSLSIMSLFTYDQIFLMKDNRLFPPNSQRPEEALEELISIENRITYLTNLFTNISSWSFAHFMIENFKEPETIESSKKDDPQFELIRELFTSNISLLDFGSGPGRLIKLIEENNLIDKFELIDVLEPNKIHHEKLEAFSIINNILTKLNEIEHNYNLILLSNVLHEIRPKEIVKTINKIKSHLKNDGAIVIIEDLVLRKGEMPNKNGYLVFNPDELIHLFSLSQEPVLIESKHEKYKKRLMCAVIAKENIGHIDKYCLQKALNKLKERSYNTLIELREGQSAEIGRNYAFYLNQFLNAEISLNDT